MAPSVSVVIPTLNEAARLPLLLDRLERQTLAPLEVIVADGGSTDETAAIAAGRGVTVVRGGSPAAGRNAGAAVARGDLILFLDADTAPPDTFMADALAEFAQRDLSVATAALRPVESGLEYAIACGLAAAYMRAIQRRSPHASGCVLVRRDVHERIGGFDEEAALAEDHDYVQRASECGAFGVLKAVRIPVSMRRVDLDGRLRLARIYWYSEMRTWRRVPVTSIPFEYAFGQHDRAARPSEIAEATASAALTFGQRAARALRTLDKPSTERQNDAIGLQLTAVGGGVGLTAGLASAGVAPTVIVPVAATSAAVSALSTYVAWRKFRLERRYGEFLIASPAVASFDIVDAEGRTLANRGIDEVCELHVIGHLLRMSALSRRGTEGRLLILLEAMRGLERLLDDLDDPRFARANLIIARSDICARLMKMGFEEVPQPPFDLMNRLNKYFIGRLLSVVTGHDRKADLDRYRLVVMPRTAFAGAAFREELARQIGRTQRDIDRLRTRAPA